jgi:hypothetical protein
VHRGRNIVKELNKKPNYFKKVNFTAAIIIDFHTNHQKVPKSILT